MNARPRRKAYSTFFRQDWVIPTDNQPCDTSSSRNGAEFMERASMSDKTALTIEKKGIALVGNEGTGASVPVPRSPRIKARYRPSHPHDWTMVTSTDGREVNSASTIAQFNGPKTAPLMSPKSEDPGRIKYIPAAHRAQSHTPSKPHTLTYRTKRQQDPSVPNVPNGSITRPSSSGSGSDAPPKLPFFESSYTLTT